MERRTAKFLLDPEQLVVLRHPLGTAGRAGLDLPAVDRDGKIGDKGIFRLAGPVGDHRRISGAYCHLDGFQALGQGPVFGTEDDGICYRFVPCKDLRALVDICPDAGRDGRSQGYNGLFGPFPAYQTVLPQRPSS